MTQKLSFISDEALISAVKRLLEVAAIARTKADNEFERNVIDPFALLYYWYTTLSLA
jgi:hypothetical protein